MPPCHRLPCLLPLPQACLFRGHRALVVTTVGVVVVVVAATDVATVTTTVTTDVVVGGVGVVGGWC